MQREQFLRRAAVLGLALVAAACRTNESARNDTAAGGSAAVLSAGPSAAATAGGGALTDPNIVFVLDQANASDSARGRLAETKGTSADVQRFGRLMVGEHHALRDAGQRLATKLNVTPQPPTGDQSEAQARQIHDSLQAMPKGRAWDRAYIDYEVTYHQQVLETATKALDAAQNQELKDLIKQAAPVVQKHLDMARDIQKKLGS